MTIFTSGRILVQGYLGAAEVYELFHTLEEAKAFVSKTYGLYDYSVKVPGALTVEQPREEFDFFTDEEDCIEDIMTPTILDPDCYQYNLDEIQANKEEEVERLFEELTYTEEEIDWDKF